MGGQLSRAWPILVRFAADVRDIVDFMLHGTERQAASGHGRSNL